MVTPVTSFLKSDMETCKVGLRVTLEAPPGNRRAAISHKVACQEARFKDVVPLGGQRIYASCPPWAPLTTTCWEDEARMAWRLSETARR